MNRRISLKSFFLGAGALAALHPLVAAAEAVDSLGVERDRTVLVRPSWIDSIWAPPPQRNYSLTIAPAAVLGAILQVNVERRLSRHVSASVLGGSGVQKGAIHAVFGDAGASLRWYPYKSTFERGPHLGVQAGWGAAWVNGSGSDAADSLDGSDRGTGHILFAGPLLGYKYTWSFGLTAELQVLLLFGRIRGTGDFLAYDEKPRWKPVYFPLPLVNAGWSF